MALWICGGIVLNACSVAATGAQPRRQPGKSWRLDVAFHDPQRITLRRPGDPAPTTYWYMLYVVTNNTGQDREFYPSFRLVTDTLTVVEGGARVGPRVYDAIIQRHRGQYAFLAPPTKVSGLLLQGEANARASVVVFHDFDKSANGFTTYCSGFSGEIQRVPNPTFDGARPETEKNPRSFVLRRTMAITYDLPGDRETRDRANPIRRTRAWVMR